jgi:hypothetical protein
MEERTPGPHPRPLPKSKKRDLERGEIEGLHPERSRRTSILSEVEGSLPSSGCNRATVDFTAEGAENAEKRCNRAEEHPTADEATALSAGINPLHPERSRRISPEQRLQPGFQWSQGSVPLPPRVPGLKNRIP